MEVLLAVSRNGKREIEPLCFLGLVMLNDTGAVLAGGYSEIHRMVENEEIEPPVGYVSRNISDLSNNSQTE